MENLTPEEKNLLAVSKFYNDNIETIERLITKMRIQYNIPLEEIAMRTGLTTQKVARIALNVNYVDERKPQRKIGTERIAHKVANQQVEIGITFDTGTIAGRVAKEVFEKWIEPYASGTRIPGARAMMDEFQVTKVTTTDVFQTLREKGLIKEKVKGNPRQGYVTA